MALSAAECMRRMRYRRDPTPLYRHARCIRDTLEYLPDLYAELAAIVNGDDKNVTK